MEINDSNQEEIAGIMKSVLVCLKFLLCDENLWHEFKTARDSLKIDNEEQLIDNIFAFLKHDICSLHITHITEEHQLFAERYALSYKLPNTAAKIISDLIKELKGDNEKFRLDFNTLLKKQDPHTQGACCKLQEILVDLGCKASKPAEGNNYCTYSEPPHHHRHHSNSWREAAFCNFKIPEIHIPEFVVHGVEEVRSLFWGFIAKVQNTFESIKTSCIGARDNNKKTNPVTVVKQENRETSTLALS